MLRAKVHVGYVYADFIPQAGKDYLLGGGHGGRKSQHELHDAAALQGSARMGLHPGGSKADIGQVRLCHVAQESGEHKMVRVVVSILRKGRIAATGSLHRGIRPRGQNIESVTRHYGAGKQGHVVRETGLDPISRVAGGIGVVDDTDLVSGLPGQMKAVPRFGNGEGCLGQRLLRDTGTDGHRVLRIHCSQVRFTDAGQDRKGGSDRKEELQISSFHNGLLLNGFPQSCIKMQEKMAPSGAMAGLACGTDYFLTRQRKE